MRLTLTLSGAVAAALLLAGCASHGSDSPLPVVGGSAPAPAQSTARASSFLLPANVRRSCETAGPGEARCFALKRVDVGGTQNITGYLPADIQAAYGLPSSTNGTGQTVAIVAADGYARAEGDLATYRSQFGLPACTTANGCFVKVNQKGQPNHYPHPNQGWDEEQAMDLDMASAVCPNCHLLLVETNNPTMHSLGAGAVEAVKLGATIVSNSYGATGTADASDYAHEGVIYVGASGESGFGVGIPAGFPTVVSVGGTSLTEGGSGRGWSETAWSGSGSGCTSFTKPSWQTDKGCQQRTMNDVAAVADPETGVAVYVNGWFQFGGTSAATPIVAAIYALAGNASTLDAAQSLYANTADLFDVTSGSNGTCSKMYLCTAGPGYDGPTGNGTPNGVGAF